MNKSFLILILFTCLIIPAYAGTGAVNVISTEVFGGGGGDMNSSHFIVHGKTRAMAYTLHSSTIFKFGDGFIFAAYPATLIRPFIVSVSPNTGVNTGPTTISIRGANFIPGSTVKLILYGQPDITGEGVSLIDSSRIDCTVNLTGKVEGAWTIEITGPDGSIARLISGFTITAPQGKIDVIGRPINYPNPFDPDKGPTTIKFKLNAEGPITMYIYNIQGTRIWEGKYDGKMGVNEVLWDGYSVFSEQVANGIYVYQITSGGRTLVTGKIAVFK
jgi:hypothetical protein